MEQFYSLVTNEGTKKIAGLLQGEKLNFSKIVIGDGGGSYYEPSAKQTKLKNKVHETNINAIKKNKDNPNWIQIESIIPANIGGFFIREVGLLDDAGALIAVGKYSETYKPLPAEGTAKELIIRIIIEVDNVDSISLTVNSNIAIVTKDDFEEFKTDISGQMQKVSEAVKQECITKAEVAKVATTGDYNDLKNKPAPVDLKGYVTEQLIRNNPLEIAPWIDFHKIGSNADYDARLHMGDDCLPYWNGKKLLNQDDYNQLFGYASNGKNAIAGVIQGGINGGHTHQEMANHIQWCKDKLNNNLNAKGVGGQSGGWGLSDLVDRVGLIKIMTGAKEVNTGTYSYTKQGVYGNNFVIEIPSSVVGTNWDVCFGSYWGGLSGKFSSFIPGNRLTYSFFTSCMGSMSNVASSSGAWNIMSGYHQIGSKRIDMTININWFTVKF